MQGRVYGYRCRDRCTRTGYITIGIRWRDGKGHGYRGRRGIGQRTTDIIGAIGCNIRYINRIIPCLVEYRSSNTSTVYNGCYCRTGANGL